MGNEIIVVTGIPRSGTSLLMQLLEKCNLPIASDFIRTSDENNPEGYFELNAVKGILKDNSFLKDLEGKCVKIVAPLPLYLDKSLKYRFIFMNRDLEEILRSQEKMLGKDQSSMRNQFKVIYNSHIDKTKQFIELHGHPILEINYKDLLFDSAHEINRLLHFLMMDIDSKLLETQIKPDLYRNRIS